MRLRRARLRSGSEDGAAAVEFALVVPLLLSLLFGIMEFGLAFNAQIVVTNAAREAARELAVNDDAAWSDITEVATDTIAPVAGQFTSVSIPPPASTGSARLCTPGERITVTVEAKRPLVALGFLPIEPFDITGKATRLCAG